MTYETFKQELGNYLVQQQELMLTPDMLYFYDDGYTPEDDYGLQLVRETNIKYHKTESDTLIGDFLVISEKDEFSQTCRFYLKYLYDEWQKNGWDAVVDIVKQNIEMVKKIEQTGILDMLYDYEAVKDHLIIRPLNFTDRRYDLKDAIYKRIGDIVLVLYLLASDENINNQHNVISVKVKREIFEHWNVDEEETWQAALLNTNIMSPPRLYVKLKDLMDPPYEKGAFMALNPDVTSFGMYDVPTLTTTSQMNGAIALFYPGVMEKLAQMAGDKDYYVAFTSIHDVKIHVKGSIAPIEVLRNIKGVNKAFPKDEILSRKVYLYEREKKGLTMLEL